MDHVTRNINNLTTLWETVGTAFNTLHKETLYNYCYVPGSDWPNRVWLSPGAGEEAVLQAIAAVKTLPHKLTYSHWSGIDEAEPSLFENAGLALKSTQVGMSLPLQAPLPEPGRLQLRRIQDVSQAATWETLYPQSFGYRISAETVVRTMQQIPYFLIHFGQEVIGTVIAKRTGEIIGVHALGIIPAFRKRGFAEEAMAVLLNAARENGATLATLQASQLGKGIYSRMGFSDDFVVRNYHLPA
ncbi:GNAT family N-acetyltransferase [Chitinophaga sp. Cy-1792]|uniref:GNAT family N-acetyltransferase n=1 Tax=Chitinophaga sp. Cy-1792 TaxID=2608339 RepID=UPI00141D85B5|nr:GNAT family N-acetyltransferase [Chitinophaga sp. Cy-1792]NIG56435.1 GNAT family N-acetyltransferase [Chitinophaga sp. Cy-1792]